MDYTFGLGRLDGNRESESAVMFEITSDDIAKLDDEQLRAVVARLCEAELRRRGLSPSFVTWGGDQNASDGGIDVRVALPASTVMDGFIPRAATGFQVKQQDMPPAEVDEEMRPKPDKKLRPSIRGLADESGAYIIVSSQGSTADTPLKSRRDAMSAAVRGEPNAEKLAVDFYDRTRIATWVRSHEGLIPWVRAFVGRAIPGWLSYGPWAYAPEPVTATYLIDDKLRIHTNSRRSDTGVSAVEGIRQLRNKLREPKSVVRLVGLSGVGKTRLVQALFDDRVGEQSLDPTLAIYTNMSDEPDPQPIALASTLVAGRTRGILVIDNCPPELHQRLSEVCRQPDSKVSVITIEYDIREDAPEGTDVFRLDSSSMELIERLLRQRHPNLSDVDTHTIADFAGGNARIALALARGVQENETVAGFNDNLLLQRLVFQRHTPDQSLFLAAQACSLVYSFNGEDVSTGDGAELVRLGNLINTTPQDLYRHIAELRQRDLAQQRAVWRAILPHAVANRLAAVALRIIPYASIEQHLLRTSAGRLMRSFSRRLGYLHASREAVAIASRWLDAEGLLADVASLDDLGRSMFINIAPVAPEGALLAIERACLSQPAACEHYITLVWSLAYEAADFARCVEVLVLIILAGEDEDRSRGREVFASLFQIVWSGTHATIEQRLEVLNSLLQSTSLRRRSLGVYGLKAVLKTSGLSPASEFDFGARPRDYGYRPRTDDEVCQWYRSALLLVSRFACGNNQMTAAVRSALAEAFRDLWSGGGVHRELVDMCSAVNQSGFWQEGWLAIRQTIDYERKTMPAEWLTEIVTLEHALRPTELVQRVRAIVLSSRGHGVDLDDFEDHTSEDPIIRIARTEALAKNLGAAVANDGAVLAELLPELVTGEGYLRSFGLGLAEGAKVLRQVWSDLVQALTMTEAELRRPTILQGFLTGAYKKDPTLAVTLLDESVEDEVLCVFHPFLETGLPVDEQTTARLKRSLAIGKCPAHMFESLRYGRHTEAIPLDDLREILQSIASKPEGHSVAIRILDSRLYAAKQAKGGTPPELALVGCELLRALPFSQNRRSDYHITSIAKSCLMGEQGAETVLAICRRLKSAIANRETYAFNHGDLVACFLAVQPAATLEGLCGGDPNELDLGISILRYTRRQINALSGLWEDDLLHWCDEQAQTRYVAVAEIIPILQSPSDLPPRWSSIALRFLERAPDPDAVLEQFVSQFMPSHGWTGSLASTLEAKTVLLEGLDAFPTLQPSLGKHKARLRRWIEHERQQETRRDRERDERFE